MKCDNCEGSGRVQSVKGHPEYGMLQCSSCDGSGLVCDGCGDPIASAELCFQCATEAAEADHADVLADMERDAHG